MFTVPNVSVFKAYFFRDFNFAPDEDLTDLKFIIDADITKAYGQAFANFNDSLFDEDSAEMIFLHLSAFYLVFDLQNSSQGLSSQSKFPMSSKSVGGVSAGFTVPDRYAKDALLSIFTGNGYGMKYLSYLIPQLVGNTKVVGGATTP